MSLISLEGLQDIPLEEDRLSNGTYDVQIEKAEPTTKRETGLVNGISLQLRILGGPQTKQGADPQGQVVFQRYYLPKEDTSPNGRTFMLMKFKRMLTNIGVNEFDPEAPQNLIGCEGRIDLKWKKDSYAPAGESTDIMFCK